MGFWSSIWGGSSPTLNQDITKEGALENFNTGVGEGLTTAGAGFQEGILSGDPTKEAQAIAPETKAAQDQAQQQKLTTAQFNNRGGGTNASTSAIDPNLRAQILALLGGLKSNTANAAVGEGTNLTNQASAENEAQAKLAQQRQQNWANSILGHAQISGIQSLEELGEQYLAGPGQTSAADTYGSGGAI
jgi:hypothetical protein